MATLSQSWKVDRQHGSFYTGGKLHWCDKAKAFFGLANESVVKVGLDSKIEATVGLEEDGVFSFAVVGETVISSHRSLLLRHWRLDGAKVEEIASWKGHDKLVTDMAVDASSTLCASASMDTTVRVWDIEGHFCTHNLRGHQNVVSIVKFHPQKLQVVSVADDFEIRVWDLNSSACVATMRDHLATISSIAFHKAPTGMLLVSGARDQVVNVWDMETCKLKKSIPVFENVMDVEVISTKSMPADSKLGQSPEKYAICTVGDKGLLKAWTPAGRCVVEKKAPHAVKGELRRVMMVDGRIVTIGEDLMLSFWELPTLEFSHQMMGHNDEVLQVRYVPDSPSVLMVCNDENPKVVDRGFEAKPLVGHKAVVLSVDVSPDGKWAATGSKDHEIRVWELATQACVLRVTGHTASVTALRFLPVKGEMRPRLVSGSQDKTIKIWELPVQQGMKEAALATSILTRAAHEKEINDIQLAPNGKLLATAGQDKVAKIWNLEGVEQGVLKGHRRGIWSVAFSPIDRVLATASGDQTIKLWNLRDYQCLKTFQGHTNSVLKVAFLPNGLQLMSAAGDGLLKLWQIRTCECAATMEDHDEKIWSFDLRGEEMVSAGADAKLMFWADNSKEVEQQKEDERQEAIQKDSRISVLVSAGKIHQALTLALELERPNQVRTILETSIVEALDKKIFEQEGEAKTVNLDKWVGSLNEANLERLVELVSRWIANGRTAHFANCLLFHILRTYPKEALTKIEGANQHIAACLEYGQRHMARLEGLLQKSYVLDFVLQSAAAGTLPETAEKATWDVLLGDESDGEDQPAAKKAKVVA